MEENRGSQCSNLTSTRLTCLALNRPWFHAPQIEAEPEQRSRRHISAPHPYPFVYHFQYKTTRLLIANICISLSEGVLWLLVWLAGSTRVLSPPVTDWPELKQHPSSPSLGWDCSEAWCALALSSPDGIKLQLFIVAGLVTHPLLSSFPPLCYPVPHLHHLNYLHLSPYLHVNLWRYPRQDEDFR